MKKILIITVLLMVLTSFSTAFGEVNTEVIITIPEYDVSVNGELIDTEHSQYPVICYKGITYFPMTFDYLNGIGLNLSYSQETGLEINVKDSVQKLQQDFLGANNTLGSKQNAQLASFTVKVNDKIIDNSAEEYPVLLYKNITYFPMTWRFAVEEFNWETSWSNQTGFGISIVKANESSEDIFEGCTSIEVYGGDLSGDREANVVVDIGFGDREYYAFTNEYGQLVKVTAKEIILQDESTEPTCDGRYYPDEAKVPGTESSTLDEGHVIADSLGGVANAYNITPQNSTLNRYGDQAYMEKVIRDAGGCTDFTAIITYPDTATQIPSHYTFTYTLMGNLIVDDFDNVNPDEVNEAVEETSVFEEVSSSGEQVEIISLDKKAEYIILKNTGPEAVDLTGWMILSVRGEQSFTFPAFNLELGATVTVGDSARNTVDFHWLDGRGTWNNSECDPAELYDDNGNLVDRCEN
jgi:hypothetical protein